MVLEKIPTFKQVKNWANTTLVTTVNGSIGDVTIEETPTGMISMWSGAIADIPSGWALCDGTGGTPNLQNKFITGAGSQYSPGATGGADSVQISENEMPSHDHTGSTTTNGSHTHTTNAAENTNSRGASVDSDLDMVSDSGPTATIDSAGNHNHSLNINNAGGDAAHENRPPYYALAYVMKL